MFRSFLAAMFLLISPSAVAAPEAAPGGVLKVDSKRLVEVIDVIRRSTFQEAQKINDMSSKNTKPIYVLLNSPGGYVYAGTTLIDAIQVAQSRGVKVVCFSGALAASMAFNALLYCDERYALPSTKLLFHPVRIDGATITVNDIPAIEHGLSSVERKIQPKMMEVMGAKPEWFQRHYQAETLWDAEQLVAETKPGWLTIVKRIDGADKNLFTIEKQDLLMMLFGGEFDTFNADHMYK